MQCVILAGGIGTRMRPLTERIPKALAPVLGKPFAHHQLTLLAREAVTEVVYCIGYKGEMIREYVGDGGRWNLAVTYVDEGAALRGTAGALRLALDQGALRESFFVLYGDSYLRIPLASVRSAFTTSGLPAMMTVYRNQGRWDTSNVRYEHGRVLLYDKALGGTGAAGLEYIDYGLTVLSRDLVVDRIQQEGRADLADLLRQLSLEKLLGGFEAANRFYEVGTPDGLTEFEAFLKAQAEES
jgi:NDP-sugar pyrophosphorylase family protein